MTEQPEPEASATQPAEPAPPAEPAAPAVDETVDGPAAAPPEEVPVADQLAAGVPPEATVTLADQRAGEAQAPVVVTPSGDLAPDPAVVPDAGPAEEGAEGDAGSGDQVAAGEAEEAAPETAPVDPGSAVLHPGVSNAPPVLPASAAAAAARAHHALGKVIEHLAAGGATGPVIRVLEAIQGDIERYVPASLLHAAEGEGVAMVSSVL